ncbi:MAG: META domain-containing protein [Desulfobacterales bacterium]|nr:META domain-containing protein [Desulfobacterales bacterium]
MYKFAISVIIAAVFLISCVNITDQKTEPASLKTPFFKTTWELVELDNKTIVQKAPVKTPFIRFSEKENKVNGHTGCNGFFGTVELSLDTIKFGPVGMTRMACQQWAETETLFLSMINKASHYDIRGDMLFFLDEKQVVVVFKASGKK